MSVRILELLQLPEPRARVDRGAAAEAFQRDFTAGMSRVNEQLRVSAAQASPTEFKSIDGQRMKLYEAFQKTSQQLLSADDPKAEQAVQRVIAAVTAVESKAVALADGARSGIQSWAEREGDFDDAMRQIGELEEAGHAKAPALRKLGDAIRQRADGRQYTESVVALDQLRPKLEQIYTSHLQQADGAALGDGARDGDAADGDQSELLKEIIKLAAEQAGIDVSEVENLKELPQEVIETALEIAKLIPGGALPVELGKQAASLLKQMVQLLKGWFEKRRVKQVCVVTVTNNTDETLTLSNAEFIRNRGGWSSGKKPERELGPRKIDKFQAESPENFKVKGVHGELTYTSDGLTWVLVFRNPRDQIVKAKHDVTGDREGEFDSLDPLPSVGDVATFDFELKLVDDPNPTKPTVVDGKDDEDDDDDDNKGGGGGGGATVDLQASCLVTINNNTSSVLNLLDQGHDRGDFMTIPEPTVQPGDSIQFVSVETPASEERGCKGFVDWEVEGGRATWRVEWDNPEEEKNTTTSKLSGDGAAEFRELDQIGQGDENVPTVFTISGAGETPVTPPVTDKNGMLPVLVIDDETEEPIANATVELADQSATTDASGIAELTAPSGDQLLTASADEYDPSSTTVTVAEGDNEQQTIALSHSGEQTGPREGLTVLVRDAETGEVIEGANVVVGDQSDTTSSNGLATVELPVGSHPYEATAEGYGPVSDSVEIIEGDNPELIIEMTPGGGPREGLTVLVKDKISGEVVEGADVTVGDQSDTTSSNGLATVELPVGTHAWDADADGYDPRSGDVEIVEGDNPELIIELCPDDVVRHPLGVLVKDKETGDPIPSADVTVGDRSGTSSANGLLTVELPAGSHDYAATAATYLEETGSVEVVEGDNEELVIEMTKDDECEHAALAVIVVDDESSEAIPDATVTVGDKTEQTPGSGTVVLTLQPGSHDYEVSADDYPNPETGTIEVAEGDDNELIVRLKRDSVGATVAFVVTDKKTGEALEGATVNLDGQPQVTDGSGVAEFEVAAGDYSYSAAKETYQDEFGSVTAVEGQTVEEPVALEKEPIFNPPPETPQPTLRKGDESEDGWVEYLQQLLNKRLGDGAVEVTGVYDQATYDAVKDFQRSTDPPCQVDGITGNETWSMLRKQTPREEVGVRQQGEHEEKGAEARWTTEGDDCMTYDPATDEFQMTAFSVGDEPVDEFEATVQITGANGVKKVTLHKLGAPEGVPASGDGQKHVVRIPAIRERFGEGTHDLQAYLDEKLGGDLWRGPVEVPTGGGGDTPGGGGGGGGGGGNPGGGGGGGGTGPAVGTLNVQVVDTQEDSNGVKGAIVSIHPPVADQLFSDDDGFAIFTNLPEGEYTVTVVSADGNVHRTQETVVEDGFGSATIAISPQSGADDVPVFAFVEVAVEDADGKEVEGATVVLETDSGPPQEKFSDSLGAAFFDIREEDFGEAIKISASKGKTVWKPQQIKAGTLAADESVAVTLKV